MKTPPISPYILVIEDEPSIMDLLHQNLTFEGYRVLEARDGQTGLKLAESEDIDLILLDLMLPKISGIEICKRLRAKGNDTPIIMLTARGESAQKVEGLKIGADDYITKPFDLMEMLARVEAVLRRTGKMTRYQDTYQLGEQVFDFSQNIIRKQNAEVQLTHQEAQLLRYLVHHEGKALSREQIFDDVWGHDYLYSYRTIDTHITRLRQKIEENPSKPKHIITVHRVGYRFVKEG